MNNSHIGEEEENCINLILEKGIEEIKNSQSNYSISNNNNNKNYTCTLTSSLNNINNNINNSSYRNINQNQLTSSTNPLNDPSNISLYNSTTNNNINCNNNNNNNTSNALRKIMSNIQKEDASSTYHNIQELKEEYDDLTISQTSSDHNTNININAPPNNIKPITSSHMNNNDNKLKEMKNRLQSLQNKIGNLDKHLHTKLTHNETSSYLINSSKHYKKSKRKSSSSSIKARSYSASKRGNSYKFNNTNKINNEIWKERFMKLKDEFNKDKNALIKLRYNKNDLNKKYDQVKKKEILYDDLFIVNQKLIDNNEMLFNQLEESEEVRNEQEKLIHSLQKEVNRLRNELRNENIDDNNYDDIRCSGSSSNAIKKEHKKSKKKYKRYN